MAWVFNEDRDILQWDEEYNGFQLRLSTPTEWGCRWAGAVKTGSVKFKFPVAKEHINSPGLIRYLKQRVDEWEPA